MAQGDRGVLGLAGEDQAERSPDGDAAPDDDDLGALDPVSYTHLTLPTSDLV